MILKNQYTEAIFADETWLNLHNVFKKTQAFFSKKKKIINKSKKEKQVAKRYEYIQSSFSLNSVKTSVLIA